MEKIQKDIDQKNYSKIVKYIDFILKRKLNNNPF